MKASFTWHLRLLLVVVAIVLTSFTNKNDKHIGKWEGEDKGKIGSIDLGADGFATFDIGGRIIGGKSFESKEGLSRMIYQVNYDSLPIQIDFIMQDAETGAEQKRLRAIFEFLNDDQMKLAIHFDAKGRPNSFEAKTAETVVLTRVK